MERRLQTSAGWLEKNVPQPGREGQGEPGLGKHDLHDPIGHVLMER